MLSTVSCKLQVLLSTPCSVLFNVPSCAFRLFEDLIMSSRRLPTPLILSLYKVIVAIGNLLSSVKFNSAYTYCFMISHKLSLINSDDFFRLDKIQNGIIISVHIKTQHSHDLVKLPDHIWRTTYFISLCKHLQSFDRLIV